MSTAPISAPQRLGVLPFGDLSVVLPDPHCVRYLNLNNPLNTKCKFCNALKWKEENITCCSKGKYVDHPLLHIPQDIKDIFSSPSFLSANALTMHICYDSSWSIAFAHLDATRVP